MSSEAKVLIIEDNIHYATVVHHSLTTHGFSVSVAEDGNKGLDKARELKPDVILLDLLMPGMDGISLLKVLKDDDDLKKIPVIILTSCDESQSKKIAQDAQADSFLNKTAEVDEIIAEINKHLAK